MVCYLAIAKSSKVGVSALRSSTKTPAEYIPTELYGMS